jgi:integrase
VPIPAKLQDHLTRHLQVRDTTSRFVFPETQDQPFRRGKFADVQRRGGMPTAYRPSAFTRRDTYASICIAAGVNAKRVSTYMGHSSIATTYDLYGHLFPGK